MHHMMTMALIFLAYIVNLLRFGTMWMAMFDIRCVGRMHACMGCDARMVRAAPLHACEDACLCVHARCAVVLRHHVDGHDDIRWAGRTRMLGERCMHAAHCMHGV